MDKKRIYLVSGLLALVLVLAISFVAFGNGSSVPLNYIASGGQDNCDLAAFNGELVMDPTAGIVFAHDDQRQPVLWPTGWTARRSGSEVEILYPDGKLFARTDTPISPAGVADAAGNWDMCGLEPITN